MPQFVEEVFDLKFVGQAKGLCLHAVDNTHHIGCDYKSCGFVCSKGLTFRNIVVGGTRWSNMERPCA